MTLFALREKFVCVCVFAHGHSFFLHSTMFVINLVYNVLNTNRRFNGTEVAKTHTSSHIDISVLCIWIVLFKRTITLLTYSIIHFQTEHYMHTYILFVYGIISSDWIP